MAKKKAPVDEVEPEEEELVLDEEADDETGDEGTDEPTGKSKKAEEVTFGVADLAKLIKKKTGKEYTTRDLRTLIRKMAREDKPRVKREITPGNRTRYDWSGPDDPEVKAILKAVQGGEVEAGKKEALEKLKATKAKERADGTAKTKDKKKGKKTKVAA